MSEDPPTELRVDETLVGRRVVNLARPEWGSGTVLRVQPASYEGRPAWRVSIQFATGHRALLSPPARLGPERPEPQRDAGWLEQAAGRTLDDRLLRLPASVLEVLGTLEQRIAAAIELYHYDEQPESLLTWARRQAGVADPLSHWSRDELLVAFRRFCAERDSHLRVLLAKLRQQQGPDAVARIVDALPEPLAERVRAALARPI